MLELQGETEVLKQNPRGRQLFCEGVSVMGSKGLGIMITLQLYKQNLDSFLDRNSKGKVKEKSLYLTLVVPSVTRLLSMEANDAPFTPLPPSVLRFTGIQSYGYTDQRKVETDVEVTEDRTRDFSL